MPTEYDAFIIEIAKSIWSSLLKEELSHTPDPSQTQAPGVTGIISFEGAWNGALMLQCDSSLAMTLTANMFGVEVDPKSDEIRDAVGELTNMLAGNVSAILPQPCHIGLPVVAFGSDYEVQIIGANIETTVGFVCEELPMTVTLLGQAGPATKESP